MTKTCLAEASFQNENDLSRGDHEEKDSSGCGLGELCWIWEEGERICGAERPGNRDSKIEAGLPLVGVAFWSLE